MVQTPIRTPQRPPRPPTRQLFLQDEPVDEQNSGDLLRQVLSKGYPSTLSVVQAIGMEEQYNFVNDKNQIAYYMMGFAGKGPGLATSSKRVGVYEKDAAQLKEHIHVLKGSVHDFVKSKLDLIQHHNDEIKAAREVLAITEDLVKFHGDMEEVTRKGNAALSGETQDTNIALTSNSPVANGFPAESPATSSFNINSVGNLLTPLSSPSPSFDFGSNSSGTHIDPDPTPNPPSQKKRRYAF